MAKLSAKQWWDKKLRAAAVRLSKNPNCPISNRYARTMASLYSYVRSTFDSEEDLERLEDLEKLIDSKELSVKRGQTDIKDKSPKPRVATKQPRCDN